MIAPDLIPATPPVTAAGAKATPLQHEREQQHRDASEPRRDEGSAALLRAP
ncbi:hypothetical protein ACWC0C_19900 [Streptomyces sp. NPDC001709]